MGRYARCEDIEIALEVLRSGGIVIYPTETVYGIGCVSDQSSAIERIVALKGSLPDAAYLILVPGKEFLNQFCSRIPRRAERLIEQFWPGPLTLVLPAKEGLHPRLVGSSGGVALRHSSHPWPRQILHKLSTGLISTSANPTGRATPKRIREVDQIVAEKVDLVVNGGELAGLASTIVDLCQQPAQLLREGVIPVDEIAGVLNEKIAFKD